MFANKEWGFPKDDWGYGAWASACGPGFIRFGRPGGHRRKRMFKRGDLKYVILAFLKEEPMHGYEIIRRLEEDSGGTYSPSPGSIYPTLQMLEDQGFVVSEQEDGKKVYRITDEGSAFLDKHTHRLEDIFGRFVDMGERLSGSDMRAVTRSFVRLAQVSFERAAGSGADEDSLVKLREILDHTTRDIERAWPDAARTAANEG